MKALIFLTLLSFSNFSLHAAESISGHWVGYFSYVGSNRAESYSVVFKQSGNSLSGTILEINKAGGSKAVALTSNLTGFVSGNSVLFTKQYDGSGGQTHQVTYELTLLSSSKLVGIWKINGRKGGNTGLAPISTTSLRNALETND